MGKKRDLEDADSISMGREFIRFRYRPYMLTGTYFWYGGRDRGVHPPGETARFLIYTLDQDITFPQLLCAGEIIIRPPDAYLQIWPEVRIQDFLHREGPNNKYSYNIKI